MESSRESMRRGLGLSGGGPTATSLKSELRLNRKTGGGIASSNNSYMDRGASKKVSHFEEGGMAATDTVRRIGKVIASRKKPMAMAPMVQKSKGGCMKKGGRTKRAMGGIGKMRKDQY